MTALDLPAIRALLEGATPGPWKTVRHDLSLYVVSESGAGLQANLGYVGNRPDADAAFIAAAPFIVAQLVAVVERVEALADELVSEITDEIGAEEESLDQIRDEAAKRIRAAIKGEGQ